jgi:hypothetical protein
MMAVKRPDPNPGRPPTGPDLGRCGSYSVPFASAKERYKNTRREEVLGDEFAALHDDLVDHTRQQIVMTPLPAMAVRPGGIHGDSYVASTTLRHTVAGSRRKQGYPASRRLRVAEHREIPVIIVEPA